jgi:phage tail sheath protein FI
MTIVPFGTLNTAAQLVPDLYVQIIPPQTYLIPGTQTNTIGVVGSASWGPVNQPVIVSDMPSYVRAFGSPVNRKYDMGTHVATAVQQGANSLRCVRVTDGSDAAAASTGVASCITFAALYTGSLGNNLTVTLSTGSKANSWKAIIGVPGGQPEVFDNISGSGNTFWVNLAAAINQGSGVLRGASRLVVATSGAGTTAASAQTFTFSGGSDGGASITSSHVVGVDTTTRTGVFALRNQGCNICVPADLDDSTKWTTVDGVCQAEQMYAILCGPSGDTVSNAISTKQTAGLDSYSTKMMFGDWILWGDPFAQINRYVSPQGFVAGRLANLSPEQSTLNKTLYGVVGSQRSNSTSATYSTAELLLLEQAGIDVITNPGGGGIYIWTCRIGHNASSNQATSGDNYTRMTNFIATSLNAGMGLYLGRPINRELTRQVKATLNSFFMGMLGQGLLGQDYDDGGNPWSVICDLGPGTNNPPERVKLSFLQTDIQCQYMAINEKFIINLEGGQTVTVTRQTLPSGQVTV